MPENDDMLHSEIFDGVCDGCVAVSKGGKAVQGSEQTWLGDKDNVRANILLGVLVPDVVLGDD